MVDGRSNPPYTTDTATKEPNVNNKQPTPTLLLINWNSPKPGVEWVRLLELGTLVGIIPVCI